MGDLRCVSGLREAEDKGEWVKAFALENKEIIKSEKRLFLMEFYDDADDMWRMFIGWGEDPGFYLSIEDAETYKEPKWFLRDNFEFIGRKCNDILHMMTIYR